MLGVAVVSNLLNPLRDDQTYAIDLALQLELQWCRLCVPGPCGKGQDLHHEIWVIWVNPRHAAARLGWSRCDVLEPQWLRHTVLMIYALHNLDVRGNAMGVGRLGILMLHRELLPVSCAESYSRSVATKSTPGMLCRKLVSIYSNESYSLYITQRATPCLLC